MVSRWQIAQSGVKKSAAKSVSDAYTWHQLKTLEEDLAKLVIAEELYAPTFLCNIIVTQVLILDPSQTGQYKNMTGIGWDP